METTQRSGVILQQLLAVSLAQHLFWSMISAETCAFTCLSMFCSPHAVGRLTLRKDGWFSYDSGSVVGVLTTYAVSVPVKPIEAGDRTESGELELVLLLNVATSVRGVVRAALLHADSSKPLPGYSCNDSVPLVGHNGLQSPLRWNSGSKAQLPVGKTSLKVRIEATYTKLFTIQLTWRRSPPPPPPPPMVGRFVKNVDIIDAKHGAYKHSYPESPWANKTMGALSCQSQCDSDSACYAWTYVEKSTPGSPERCCFAASVGCPHHSDGIVSGAKATGPCTPGMAHR